MTEFDPTADTRPDSAWALNAAAPPPLGSLLRKAAVDAGFDLEPEIDGSWWRLRASGAAGVAWVHPLPGSVGARLALPVQSQLDALDLSLVIDPAATPSGEIPVPLGAAGAVTCPSPSALHEALRRVRTLRAYAPERLRARWEAGVAAALAPTGVAPGGGTTATPAVTEAIAEVRRRVGQDLFREALLDYWGGRCAVTGLAVPELLRASHAKPWADATDVERLDVHNGLLLAVHLDALFDRGFLTFDDEGQGVLSERLKPDARAVLGIEHGVLRLRRLAPGHRWYLRWHRERVFQL